MNIRRCFSCPSLCAAMLLAALLVLAGCGSSAPAASDRSEPADTTAEAEPVPRAVPTGDTPQEEAVRARGVDLDTVQARRFDDGRMWTFEHPPLDYLRERYDFSPDSSWFRSARLGALRIPGCSASFASPHGLMLTNHHCGRDYVEQVSRPGEDLLENGFYARTLDQERPAEGLYAEQLIAIQDVTDEIRGALEGAQTDAERAQARQDAIDRVEARVAQEAAGEDAGISVEVVSLYNGAQYSAYTFRRYDNVRLVMAPELQLGYYGGDPDNFTYPRYVLDMTLFRIYTDAGEPLQNEHYFAWDEDGSQEGDLVFVVGNPGSTSRLETVAQLQFRRDVQDQAILDFVSSRAEAFQAYQDAHPEEAKETGVRNQLFGLKNARKLYRGRLKALRDPVIMARRQDRQQQFQQAIEQDTALRAQYGKLISQMAEMQEQKRELAPAFRAFATLNPSSPYASATLRRALLAFQYLSRKQQGASEEALSDLEDQLLGIADQPPALDRRLMAARLSDFQQYLGDSSDVVQNVLQGRASEAVAETVISESVLADSAQAAQALSSGTLAMSDPALQLTQAYLPRYANFQSGYAGLSQQQQALAGELGRARFAVYGTDVPPDVTSSLRISDGQVRGYEYNGTVAAPYTAFYGLYDHYYAYGPDTPWDLPERWLDPPQGFDRSTSLDLVSTNDITGGNSGSPLINQDLELVGVAFDGNIQSLASDYIYLPKRMRAISVDVRGMLEALDVMYDLDRLVVELTQGQLVRTEEEADALTSSGSSR